MFDQSIQFYDRIYAGKDYEGECAKLKDIIQENLRSSGDRLLDVACGTGHHLEFLKGSYSAEGLDISAEILQLAVERNPEVAFHQGDMIDFDLERRFDVVTCLFSSIGYVRTLENLNRAVACMARCLVPGGILIVEPWFTPERWTPGTVHALFVDEPELKIARVNVSEVNGRLSFFEFHYLVGTPAGVDHFTERHELGLFEVEEMKGAFVSSGLQVSYDEQGIAGRGLYLGLRPYQ